ncbi:hypothetical protein AB0J82_35125 [Asanoa sp. NPDC049518]|uniref:hypothetical protein n=1 Tax=unclassified Asanoa TaxID=2685164 RepID=UPI00343D9996
MNHRSIRYVGAALGALVLVLSGLTSSASANPSTPPTEDGKRVILRVTAQPPANARAAAITCELAAHNPHKSTHVSGTINVTATWTCSAPVTRLTVTARLWRNVSTLVNQGYNETTGNRRAQANAAGGCTTGLYDGTTAGTVYYPPGYTPATMTGYDQGPAVNISCP